MNNAVDAASGEPYEFSQSFTLYPTSGASDDYAYSHFVAGCGTAILSYTVEWAHSFPARPGKRG